MPVLLRLLSLLRLLRPRMVDFLAASFAGQRQCRGERTAGWVAFGWSARKWASEGRVIELE